MREAELAEPRKKDRGAAVDRAEIGEVTIPEPSEEWGVSATMTWNSVRESGASTFYASSDYAVLWLICDNIDAHSKQGGRRSPEMLRVILSGLGSLLATEGDRRRLRVELTQPEEGADVDGSIASLLTLLPPVEED